MHAGAAVEDKRYGLGVAAFQEQGIILVFFKIQDQNDRLKKDEKYCYFGRFRVSDWDLGFSQSCILRSCRIWRAAARSIGLVVRVYAQSHC